MVVVAGGDYGGNEPTPVQQMQTEQPRRQRPRRRPIRCSRQFRNLPSSRRRAHLVMPLR